MIGAARFCLTGLGNLTPSLDYIYKSFDLLILYFVEYAFFCYTEDSLGIFCLQAGSLVGWRLASRASLPLLHFTLGLSEHKI